MAARQAKTLYPITRPRRYPGLRTLMWLIIGFSLLILFGSGWALVLLNGRIASHHNFVGQLSPDSDPVIVSLPRGSILQDIQVSRNTQIRRGQTIATLNIDAMTRHIDMGREKLLHDEVLRECLLQEELPETGYFVDLPDGARDQARLARQECQEVLVEKHLIEDRLKQKQDMLRDEQALVERYQRLLSNRLQRQLPPEEREADARQALALSLLKNKLQQQLSLLQFDADKEGAAWQKSRLKRVRELMAAIHAQSEFQNHMKTLLKRPRLQAPEDGFVVQVRSVSRDAPMKDDIDLVVLRPKDHGGYRASFEVPHNLLDAVATGDEVQIRMLGMLDGGPKLNGTVSGLRSTGNTQVRAYVSLDEESTSTLDDPRIGVALRGLGTASIIQVRKADQYALPVLETILKQALLQPGKRWFLARLLSPPPSDNHAVRIGG